MTVRSVLLRLKARRANVRGGKCYRSDNLDCGADTVYASKSTLYMHSVLLRILWYHCLTTTSDPSDSGAGSVWVSLGLICHGHGRAVRYSSRVAT